MSEHIKKAINDFKTENGNDTFTQKDLLMYLVKRIDDLPCVAHMGEIKEVKTLVKQWRWFAGILLTIVLSIVALSTQV